MTVAASTGISAEARVREDPTIHPDKLYSAREVAEILGYRSSSDKANTNRIYEISDEELPRVPVGPRGGKRMIWGRDILDFIEQRRQGRRLS